MMRQRRGTRQIAADENRGAPFGAFLFVAAASFALFWWVGGQGFLIEGFDHGTTGHAMLLSEGYLHAGFRTPLWLPVEDARGPLGTWAPYTGWPPLFFIALAVFRRLLGTSLATARIFFCLINALSAGLVALLAWKTTSDRFARVFAVVVFCFHPVTLNYCGLGFSSTAGLAWSLGLVLLHPWAIEQGSGWRPLPYAILTAIGSLISWECVLVPVACALASVSCQPDGKREPRKWLTPIMSAGITAALLIAALQYVGARYEPNGWYQSPEGHSIAWKFLDRTGWAMPHLIIPAVSQFVMDVIVTSSGAIFALFALLWCRTVWFAREAAHGTSERDGQAPLSGARFYLRAVCLWPLLWFCLVPLWGEHTFGVLLWLPCLAVGCAAVLSGTARAQGSSGRRLQFGCGLVALCLLVVFGVWRVAARKDSRLFTSLERDIDALCDERTVIVTSFNDRGAWWRLQRSVISLDRLSRIRDRPHVIVLGLPGDELRDGVAHYREIMQRGDLSGRNEFAGRRYTGYRILAPVTPR